MHGEIMVSEHSSSRLILRAERGCLLGKSLLALGTHVFSPFLRAHLLLELTVIVECINPFDKFVVLPEESFIRFLPPRDCGCEIGAEQDGRLCEPSRVLPICLIGEV